MLGFRHERDASLSYWEVSRRVGCAATLWSALYDRVLEEELQPNECLVEFVAVRPEARGRGVGGKLMRWAEATGAALLRQHAAEAVAARGVEMTLWVSVQGGAGGASHALLLLEAPVGPGVTPASLEGSCLTSRPPANLCPFVPPSQVAADNAPAAAMYRRMGYAVTRCTDARCCAWASALWLRSFLGHPVWHKMAKSLAPPAAAPGAKPERPMMISLTASGAAAPPPEPPGLAALGRALGRKLSSSVKDERGGGGKGGGIPAVIAGEPIREGLLRAASHGGDGGLPAGTAAAFAAGVVVTRLPTDS